MSEQDVQAQIQGLREHLDRVPPGDSTLAKVASAVGQLLDGFERERANNLLLRAENAELRELVKELAP